MPQSDTPGEKTWPTQPMPVTPAALGQQSFTAATDIVTLTPELEAVCRT